MIAAVRSQFARLIRGVGLRQIRLACGLVLFAYLVSHFLNHALGNISMAALATGCITTSCSGDFPRSRSCSMARPWFTPDLGIWALYQRRQFHWRAIEPLQLVLGLSIPALIIAHIVGVRLGQSLFGA